MLLQMIRAFPTLICAGPQEPCCSFCREQILFFPAMAEPNYDNMFAGSNFDAEDFDDYNVLQRDMQVDGGLRPVTEEEVIQVRNKAGRAVQAVFRQLGLTPISDEQVEAVTYAHGSRDTLPRDVTADLMSAEDVLKRGITGVDVVKALAESGFEEVAERLKDEKEKISQGINNGEKQDESNNR